MIIDAEGPLGDVLKAALSQAGHEVAATTDGMAAVEAYKHDRPDVVLLDRDMPELLGSRVLRSLKGIDPQANVLMLYRDIDPESEVEYRRIGARIFLSKAVGIDTLLHVVKRSLKLGSGASGYDGSDQIGKSEVLVIDDDVNVRDTLKPFLEGKGYEVSTAKDGEDALRIMRSSRPRMILLDVKMPKMNGVEALQAIRRINTQVPILMITGQDDLETVRECMRLGAFDYMIKPLNLEYLETIVWGKLLSI
ncbi:MAG: response regulator [Elusimicrobia bacterium]|nr:response regulator [Elusimicrobiota bacterium]